MKLSIPVRVSKRTWKSFVSQAEGAGYKFTMKKNLTSGSLWIDDVAVGEYNIGGYWMYPLNAWRMDEADFFPRRPYRMGWE